LRRSSFGARRSRRATPRSSICWWPTRSKTRRRKRPSSGGESRFRARSSKRSTCWYSGSVSADLLVRLRRERLPSTHAWNEALRGRGFKVILDKTCDTATHDGYLPARVLGEDGGFEYTLAAPGETQDSPDHDT